MDLGILNTLKGSGRITAESLQNAIVEAINQRILKPGDKLPSTRELSLYLGISRTTVVKAIEILISTGHLVTAQGAGTWVAATAALERGQASLSRTHSYPWEERYSHLARTIHTNLASLELDDFDEINFGAAPLDLVPFSQWRKILLRRSAELETAPFDANSEVFGYRPLREAIVGFLGRSKGIVCDAEQVVLHSGVQSVVSPVFSLFVKPGDTAICENPGFYGAREQFENLGATVVTAPVDEQGLIVDALENIPSAQWLYIASSCQEPTGVTLSESRKRALVEWCNRHQTAILEDDWDSEFHYSGPTAPSLYTMDKTGSVIYFYTFWRLLYPLVSVGFIVIPHHLIPLFERYKNVWDRQFSLIEHYVLTDLLNEGHVEKHIRMMWKNFRKQRQCLIFALTNAFKGSIHVSPSSRGMHVVAQFDAELSAEHIKRSAQQAGLAIASTEPFYVGAPHRNEFMMRFTCTEPDRIEDQVRDFARLVNSL